MLFRSIDGFIAELRLHPPPLARIDDFASELREPLGEAGFRIDASSGESSESPIIAADTATCADCLREVFDPDNRRHGHAFANCTNCGPRLTIVNGAPYDRAKTTMAGFELCPECRREYESPSDRRFHVQPVACSQCGPRLSLSLDEAASRLLSGEIGAIKGVGGYHLACDATNEAVVSELRRRKHRDAKPFAVLVRDIEQAASLCEIGKLERSLLLDRAAPIVLSTKRSPSAVATAVAPGLELLGLMLPSTPLHHLLIRAVGRPLVLTSGNRSDEPMVYDRSEERRVGKECRSRWSPYH